MSKNTGCMERGNILSQVGDIDQEEALSEPQTSDKKSDVKTSYIISK